MQKHYQRKHPGVNFAKDFKPPPKPSQQPSQTQEQQSLTTAAVAREQLKANNEMLATLRSDLDKKLSQNVKKIEAEFVALKQK